MAARIDYKASVAKDLRALDRAEAVRVVNRLERVLVAEGRQADGTLSKGRVLLDMASDDADGALLGRIVPPEFPANLAWGEDGSVLSERRHRGERDSA